jgi:hypothetical protein
MAAESVITINQGKVFTQTITVNNSMGLPYDFVGSTVIGQLRRGYFSQTAIDFDIDVQLGQVVISLAAEVTASLLPHRYVFEVILQDSFGNSIDTLSEGIAIINLGVVR